MLSLDSGLPIRCAAADSAANACAGRAGNRDRGFRNDAVVQAQCDGDTDHGIAARGMADLAIAELRAGIRTGNVDRHQHFSRPEQRWS